MLTAGGEGACAISLSMPKPKPIPTARPMARSTMTNATARRCLVDG